MSAPAIAATSSESSLVAGEKYRPVLGWGTSFEDEESRAFLAQRIAFYAWLVGSFFAMLYLVGVVVVLAIASTRTRSISRRDSLRS